MPTRLESRQFVNVCWALAVSLALSPAAKLAEAKKLYKYQDENGNWHFDDRPPDSAYKAEVMQLKAEHQQRVWLYERDVGGFPSYFAHNNYPAAVEVEILFSEASNARSTPPLPARFIVNPGDSPALVQITPIDPRLPVEYTLRHRHLLGDPRKQYDPNAEYLPPFDPGASFMVTQGFNGIASHQDKQNRYAVDIAMPEGTPVYAARGGIVVEVESDFYESGMTLKNLSRANNVRILHEDGSIAIYAHLQLETTQVYPGLPVEAGQLIAYSGNTGFSSGPHLHFAVQVNQGMDLVSVPFKFQSIDHIAQEPVAGTMLHGYGGMR